ncbi:MAG: PaRep2b protein, partial [Thermoproteus sp.]
MTAGGARLTPSGRVAADLTISEGGAEVKYGVYLRNKVVLQFISTDRGRAELAARLLRLAGVDAEARRSGGLWYVAAYTDELAAGRRELREAVAAVVKEALARGWADAGKAERWLRKLERRRTARRGWPKYRVGLVEGALEVRYRSTSRGSIEREARRLAEMGLREGAHFTVKMPEGGRKGHVSILKGGLAYAAWLSAHGSGDQRRLAAEFVEYILQRAKEEDGDVHEKALEVVEAGRAVGSMRLADVRRVRVEADGGSHVVTVLGGGAELDRGRSGKPLLRIRITAEVDGVRSDYMITFSRYGRKNAVVGYATAKAK